VLKQRFFGLAAGVGMLAALLPLGAQSVAAASCTPTGFVKDGINLTAAVINPGNIANTTINASGCNIGIYYPQGTKGNVTNVTVSGANYFGIVNDGGRVNVVRSWIHDIGEVPFNGTQHGVAIYFTYNSGAAGEIAQNTVTNYQKNGIVVSGGSDSANIHDNTVVGHGRVNSIAENGIELVFGASGTIWHNAVSGNAYTGTGNAVSTGILVFGGCGDPMVTGVNILNNTVSNNDIGIYLYNDLANDPNAACSTAPTTKTQDSILGNRISNDAVTNISGNGDGRGYQAGIVDFGNGDVVAVNTIAGAGYAAQNNTAVVVRSIDTTGSVNPKVALNNVKP
jgi:hypothetical protein